MYKIHFPSVPGFICPNRTPLSSFKNNANTKSDSTCPTLASDCFPWSLVIGGLNISSCGSQRIHIDEAHWCSSWMLMAGNVSIDWTVIFPWQCAFLVLSLVQHGEADGGRASGGRSVGGVQQGQLQAVAMDVLPHRGSVLRYHPPGLRLACQHVQDGRPPEGPQCCLHHYQHPPAHTLHNRHHLSWSICIV